MGTATDFRSPSLLETKHFDERKSDGSPHFFTRTHFYHALLATFRRKKEKLRGAWAQSANFASECARKLFDSLKARNW